MPININYPEEKMPTNEESNPWIGAVNAINQIKTSMLDQQRRAQVNQFQPDILRNQVLEGQLGNQKSEALLPFAAPQAQADLSRSQAQIPYVQEQTRQLKFENNNPLFSLGGMAGNIAAQRYLEQTGDVEGAKKMQSYIAAETQAKQNYGMGGLGGVDIKNQMYFEKQLQLDHPDWSPEKVRQASGAYQVGMQNLPDGTTLPPLSGKSKSALDLSLKGHGPTGSINQMIQAKQAEAEIGVLQPFINKAYEDLGPTYSGYSPQQIVDSFKKDKASEAMNEISAAG